MPKHRKKPYSLSYESDGKMGKSKQESKKIKNKEEQLFFNTDQGSE
ncbi:hypothetical protein PY093_03150 [Cytobacillus sp. S13-E01]|nr:hypothetical protein [Cytobacillus sp. S13-E01]MDF0725709.1 hypothetical protein [Cytobacillus sp. S13-E01]